MKQSSNRQSGNNQPWFPGRLTREDRARSNGHEGCIVWLTGLSGAGKSTLASGLERALFEFGWHTYVLDGDNLRDGLCSDLGFSLEARTENVRRVGEVARLFADAGLIVISALISPMRAHREFVRGLVQPGQFIEVFVNAPLEVCERRDPKGLYAKARAGDIPDFTGISAPYEAPSKPDVELRTDLLTVAESVSALIDVMRDKISVRGREASASGRRADVNEPAAPR